MAAPRFRNEDEEAQHCLSALRDGTPDEKVGARLRLAAIFARRGLFEEAADLYEQNVRVGVRSPELFERLSEAYRGLGDDASADAALVEARRLGAGRSNGSRPESVDPPAHAADRPATVLGDETADPPFLELASRPIPFSDARSVEDESDPDPAPASRGTRPPDTADDVRASGSRVPRPLTVLAALVFGAVVPIVLLALLVVNPLSLYLEGRDAGPTIDANPAATPTLKVAAGMSSAAYLRVGRSVSGLWATRGLDLRFDEPVPGLDRSVTVTAPRPPAWGETITVVERRGQGRANQGTTIPITFQAPDPGPPAGTILAGRVEGDVIAPRLSENSQFTTTTERVDVPIRLIVVPSYELWWDRFVNAADMFFDEDRWLLVSIGALLTWCVLAGILALLVRGKAR
jgi:hypothetical protein